MFCSHVEAHEGAAAFSDIALKLLRRMTPLALPCLQPRRHDWNQPGLLPVPQAAQRKDLQTRGIRGSPEQHRNFAQVSAGDQVRFVPQTLPAAFRARLELDAKVGLILNPLTPLLTLNVTLTLTVIVNLPARPTLTLTRAPPRPRPRPDLATEPYYSN